MYVEGGGMIKFFIPGTVWLNWSMSSRKPKLVGRDIQKFHNFLITPVLMSVISYIHCKEIGIQNLTFSPFHTAGLRVFA